MTRILSRVALFLVIFSILGACTTPAPKERIKPEDRGKVAILNTQIAVAYIGEGDLEAALEKLNKAVASDPNYAPARGTLGLLYNRIGDFEKAHKNFKKALRIDPDSSSILNNYGQVLCQHGRHEQGQTMFLRANENPLYRTPEIALSNAGTCAMDANDITNAEKHFRAALTINPRVAPPLLQMALLSLQLERYMPARAYLQRYLEIGKHTAQSLWAGIQIERELGDKDAQASYKLLLEKEFPDSEQAQQYLESEGA